MATRLYFHAATNSSSGLPTTEQSSLAPESGKGDALTLNRQMNITIGTSQANVTIASVNNTSAHNYYFCRFVSPPLFQTSIAQNTWTYNFAASESNTSANFPVTTNNKAVRVTCYVWRPSNSSKVGDVLDGTSAATVDEGGAGAEVAHNVTFSGSAVSNMEEGDVLVFEVWFVVTQGASTSYNDIFYFDGTTANTTDNASVSNHASFVETPENLLFNRVITKALSTETITVSETVSRLTAKRRSLSTESKTVAESPTIARLAVKARTLTTQIVTVSEPNIPTWIKAKNVAKSLTTETITVGAGTLARLKARLEAITTETVTIGAETLARLADKIRALTTQTVTNSEDIAIEKTSGGPNNVVKTITETLITVSGSFSRLAGKWRLIE